MRRLRLDLGYDGTDFRGWAAQPGLRTVQGEIEAALAMASREEATPQPRGVPRKPCPGLVRGYEPS